MHNLDETLRKREKYIYPFFYEYYINKNYLYENYEMNI